MKLGPCLNFSILMKLERTMVCYIACCCYFFFCLFFFFFFWLFLLLSFFLSFFLPFPYFISFAVSFLTSLSGQSVRQKSKRILELVTDEGLLAEEREKVSILLFSLVYHFTVIIYSFLGLFSCFL